jgi:hypothetical protein
MGTISGPSRLDLYRSTLKKRAVVLDATQIYLRRSSCGTPSPRGAVTAPLLALQSRPSSGTVARHLSILGISSTVAASFHPPSETMFDGQSGFLSTFCMRRTFPGIWILDTYIGETEYVFHDLLFAGSQEEQSIDVPHRRHRPAPSEVVQGLVGNYLGRDEPQWIAKAESSRQKAWLRTNHCLSIAQPWQKFDLAAADMRPA